MGVRPAVISPEPAATPSVMWAVRRLWNQRRPAVLVALSIAAATLWSFWPTLVRLYGAWVHDPQQVKPGNKMPGLQLGAPRLQAIVAYLESLR